MSRVKGGTRMGRPPAATMASVKPRCRRTAAGVGFSGGARSTLIPIKGRVCLAIVFPPWKTAREHPAAGGVCQTAREYNATRPAEKERLAADGLGASGIRYKVRCDGQPAATRRGGATAAQCWDGWVCWE